MIVKIGLLLDSWQVPAWQKSIIDFIKTNPSFSIRIVVLNEPKLGRLSDSWVYKFFRRIDRCLFTTKHDCFLRVNVEELLREVSVMHVKPIVTKYSDEFSVNDLEIVKSKELDVLIRFGFRILKGEILQAARYGVWSLHHGDSAVNRGGPPAFWEVVNKEPVTGVTLQVLSNDLDGGAVIDKAFVKTDRTSFNRNQNGLYWAGIELFCSSLQKLADHGLIIKRDAIDFYSKPLYRDPTNARAILIFLKFWMRRFMEATHALWHRQQWSLYYRFMQGHMETSLFRYKKLTPPSGVDWADPFIVNKDDSYYLFFEELFIRNKKAHISYFEFDAFGKLKSDAPVKILEEPFHLSYPFIFEHAGDFYMIPEAAESKNVWLYKCEQFPGRWKKHQLLLKDTSLYDPTLLYHNHIWYLFGTQKPFVGNSPDQYLHIYFSDNLFSNSWKPHPQNPVTRDVRGARPAGRIFQRNGKLIRPAQIGAPKYGYGIRLMEIIELTPDVFEEREFEDILPDWNDKLLATHTFGFANGFSVVDGQI